ncbi:MAG TPA: hypothetical protein VF746_02565 [Longimicrobium sp.]
MSYAYLAAVLLHLAGAGPADTTDLDSVEVYAALVAELRAAHPGLAIALDESPYEHCTPPFCDEVVASGRFPEVADLPSRHAAGLVETLRRRGLIQETCRRAAGTVGCGVRGAMYVGLGPIRDRPPGSGPPIPQGVWVQATTVVPCGPGCHADVYGDWYRLEGGAGGWKVVQMLPAFVV